jgi:hypothetical protein
VSECVCCVQKYTDVCVSVCVCVFSCGDMQAKEWSRLVTTSYPAFFLWREKQGYRLLYEIAVSYDLLINPVKMK